MVDENPHTAVPRWIDRALDSLSDGLILLDATQHVAYWNSRAEDILGWPAAEMVGRRADEMVDRVAARVVAPDSVRVRLSDALDSPASDKEVEFELSSAGAAGKPEPTPPSSVKAAAQADVTAPVSHAQGEQVRYVVARFFPVRGAERTLLGTGILLRDVTREREADAMKSQLLSTVSHELRTPLSSIKGFATTLLRQDVKWDEITQRDFLRIIEEETDRLTEIIDNLLDMSQIEAGALRIDKTPVQMRALTREVVDEMRMRTEAHWFVVDLPSDLPQVYADPRRVRQVLHNLLENAIKYSKGGQITLACEVEGDSLVVSISDQGEGIPPELLNKVFERFFQIDGTSTRRVGGSGLGLSISRGIVAAHGGRIWAESVVGQGSTFRFTLPLASSEANE